jgi:chaperonin GroEL
MGLHLILAQLDRLTLPIQGQAQLTQFAESIYGDPVVARLLGEIFDVVGEHGQVDVRTGYRRAPDREYVEGAYWPSGVISRQMLTDSGHQRVTLEDAAIMISDLVVDDPWALAPVLDMVPRAGAKALLIVAASVGERVLAPLLAAQHRGQTRVVAVKTPGSTPENQFVALEDLAVLTGGRPLLRAAGESLGRLRPEDLGRAAQVWADPLQFGVIAGRCDPQHLRRHIYRLRASYSTAKDATLRQSLQVRLGKLVGGSATLWLGGATEAEIKTQKAAADRAVKAMRSAVREGVVPGGGAALLVCRAALQEAMGRAADTEAMAAYRVLYAALEAPFRTIMCNAGFDPSSMLAQAAAAGSGFGLDVRTGHIVHMGEIGIWDSAAALKAAVRSAVQTAALALTVDVVVYARRPERALTP